MQMSENNRFLSFALDLAHVKFDVWNGPKRYLIHPPRAAPSVNKWHILSVPKLTPAYGLSDFSADSNFIASKTNTYTNNTNKKRNNNNQKKPNKMLKIKLEKLAITIKEAE